MNQIIIIRAFTEIGKIRSIKSDKKKVYVSIRVILSHMSSCCCVFLTEAGPTVIVTTF